MVNNEAFFLLRSGLTSHDAIANRGRIAQFQVVLLLSTVIYDSRVGGSLQRWSCWRVRFFLAAVQAVPVGCFPVAQLSIVFPTHFVKRNVCREAITRRLWGVLGRLFSTITASAKLRRSSSGGTVCYHVDLGFTAICSVAPIRQF